MMIDERLTSLVSIPRGGSEPFDGRWSQVEESLGIQLPGSYKSLIDKFGASTWADFLHVLSPFQTCSRRVNVLGDVAEFGEFQRPCFVTA